MEQLNDQLLDLGWHLPHLLDHEKTELLFDDQIGLVHCQSVDDLVQESALSERGLGDVRVGTKPRTNEQVHQVPEVRAIDH